MPFPELHATSVTNTHHSEEQQPLEEFFKAKNIRFKNEMSDDVCLVGQQPTTLQSLDANTLQQTSALIAAALDNDDMMSSDEDGGRADRGSADEDEESVDEDFQAESESDVAEEFDSEHESSGSASDAEMDDASDAGDDEEDVDMSEEEERPKKKSKIGKQFVLLWRNRHMPMLVQ